MNETAIVIPNLNGKNSLKSCIDSLISQTVKASIIVVENGSTDGSAEYLKNNFTDVIVLAQPKNLGFAGGVNVGIKYAIKNGCRFVALFNNDAVADPEWLESLLKRLVSDDRNGIVTGKILSQTGETIDSTGDFYTIWGLPYPRGRGEENTGLFDEEEYVFGASGGASLYRVTTLNEVGLFDEDFFAYYEDIDISFRAQLAGWHVFYEPKALTHHQIGATSSKIKGFTTYQTIKNLPWLLIKDVPGGRLFMEVLLRFTIAYFLFILSAFSRGQIWPAIKGVFVSLIFLPKKLAQRFKIQSKRKVNKDYIANIIVNDLPPNAKRLRKLRNLWHRA